MSDWFERDLEKLAITIEEDQRAGWFLAYDSSCPRCTGIQQAVLNAVGEQISTISIYEEKVGTWQEKAFGTKAPWAPTLFRVEGDSVQAWVGIAMAVRLTTVVGPIKAWRLAHSVLSTAANYDEQFHGALDRRAFIKGLSAVTAGAALLKVGQTTVDASGVQIMANPESCMGVSQVHRYFGSRVLNVTSNCRVCPDGPRAADVYEGDVFYFNASAVKDGYIWYHSSGPIGCWVRETQFA